MTNTQNNTRDSNDDIALGDLLIAVITYQKIIFIVTSFFAVAALVYALLLPNIYMSSAILEASKSGASTQNTGQSTGGGLGGFGGMLGVSLGSNNDEAQLAIATIKSRDFFKRLIEKDSLFLPKIIAVQNYNKRDNFIEFDSSMYDQKENKWKIAPPSHIASFKHYLKILTIQLNKKTGYVEIGVSHESPQAAKDILSMIIQETNSILKEQDSLEAQASLDYLYAQLGSVNQKAVVNSISSLITQQLRKLTLVSVKTHYLLEPIDAPFVPESKVSPKRAQICILITFLGFILSVVGSVIWHFGIAPFVNRIKTSS
tara:strand:- start:51 stop:995 length:945 start_codon:yes stop_codon:yes gene_type:complete